jgi:hypothetical protein
VTLDAKDSENSNARLTMIHEEIPMTEIAIATSEHSFIATTPAQMEASQQYMIVWCNRRLEREKMEIADLERTIAEAQAASLKTGSWKRRLAMARAKMTFYRKVKLALQKGYYIVPPFPVQRFAIRTNAVYPRGHSTNYRNQSDWEQSAQLLQEGDGDFENPFPTKEHYTYQVTDDKGQFVEKTAWRPGVFDGLDFPFKLAKPEIIAAVGRALQDKLFDALGVLPQYKTPDPIVVGQLIPPHRRHDPLCFFVAWWMDPEKL